MKKLILKCSMPLLLLTGLFYPKPYEASAASGSVSINETNFPDPTFRAHVQWKFDTNDDWKLSDSELQNATEIQVQEREITSLEGIEYFYALEYLCCYNNKLTSLDVSDNTALKRLYCINNKLTSLDVSGAIALKWLYCSNNKLSSLDVSDNIALEILDCSYNELTLLDVSGTIALEKLDCSENRLLPSLDVSEKHNLRELHCNKNFLLEKLDVSGDAQLEWIRCEFNRNLTSLDVSDNISLRNLNCNYCSLTSLDLSNNRMLKTLYCKDNKLFELNLINNTECSNVDCSYNPFVSLNLNKISKVGLVYDALLIYAPNNQFDLSTLSGDFDISKANSWQNGTVNGTILSIDNPSAPVEYLYDAYGTGENCVPLKLRVNNQYPDLVLTKEPSKLSTLYFSDVISAEYGELVKVSVKAIGKNPTYQWYVCSPNGTKFSKSSITTSTYTIRMNEAVDGRKIYCVITDDNGNTVTTKTVTLKSKVAITQQPTDTLVKIGSKASTTVHATGNGLKYQWYVKNPSSTKFTLSSITNETYSFEMTESKSGRQVYCVITDKYGNTVTSDTVTLGGPVKITAQPTNASATIGSTVKTTVTATGVGLKYQWYFKNPTSTTFAKSSVTDATYSATMTESKSERQVYCVITDKNGNTKKTNTVTLTSKVKITQQPKDVVGEFSTKVTTTVKATGNDLKYQWYVRDLNYKDWKPSSITTNEYSFVLNGSKYGRKVYCVITDKYGNEVTTRTVTFITPGFQVYYADEYRYNKKTFTFRANGALDLSAPYSDHNGAVIINGDVPYHGGDDSETVLKLKICSDADWKVSSSANYVIFEDIAGNPINSGTKGASWLIVYLDKFLSDSKESTRECTITIESGGEKREHTLVQRNYQINGMTKDKYLASVDPAIKELTKCETAMNYLKVKCITDGEVEYKKLTPTLWLGIYSRETSPDDIELEYIVFAMDADYNRTEEPADYTSEIYGYLRVEYVYGMKIVPNVNHMITTNFPIDSAGANSTDELHKAFEKYFETAKDHANETTDVLLEYFSLRLNIDIVGLDYIIGKAKEELIEDLCDNIIEGDDDDGYVVCKAPSKATILDECALSNVGNSIEVRNFTDTPDSNSAIYFSFDIVNSHNQKVTFDSGNVLSEDDQTWDVEDNK